MIWRTLTTTFLFTAGLFAGDVSTLHFEPLPQDGAFIARMGSSRLRLDADGAHLDAVRMRLIGAQRTAPVGVDRLTATSNYFLGSDASRWRKNVAQFSQVEYRSVYPGVDLLYHAHDTKRIEYDFAVAAGADPSRIAIAFDGASLKINADGSLTAGPLHFAKPVAMQGALALDVQYVVTRKHEVRFRLGAYDHTQPLLIDPTLVFSTFLGGSQFDNATAVTVDAAGNSYVTGTATSLDFPVLGGVQSKCQVSRTGQGCQDVFVSKFSPTGALIYSTYLGGSDVDSGNAIAVDASGAVYITGATSSADFPLLNPFQSSHPATSNVFVTKLNPAGSALVYSTFLGGTANTLGAGDFGYGIAVDRVGNAYVVGATGSFTFPIVNPIQSTHTGNFAYDGFVSVFNASGSALLFSTYLGGNNLDSATGVALDSTGNIYVTGWTASPDFPVLNPYQSTLRGGSNSFVTKISPAYQLVYSTFIGGSASDRAAGIAVDASGAVYITGRTGSKDFPLVNPTQTAPTTNLDASFVAKFSPSGSSLLFSTYLGGTSLTAAAAITLDAAGNFYVAGGTSSFDFPVLAALQSTKGGIPPAQFGDNAFVTKYSSANQVVYSTYLGGDYTEDAAGIAATAAGDVVVVGKAWSWDFPTFNAYQSVNKAAAASTVNTGMNAFVARLSDATAPCAYQLVAKTTNLLGNGDSGAIRVNTNSGTCAWTASVSDPWITFNSTAAGQGIGTTLFTVAPNPTLAPRTTTITSQGQTLKFTQSAPSHVVAANASALPSGTARVPVSLAADPLLSYVALKLTFTVTPNSGAPALTSPLAFQPTPGIPAPIVNATTTSITLSWPSTQAPSFQGTLSLGEVLIPIPAGATVGQSYSVQSTGTGQQFASAPFDTLAAVPAVTVTVNNPAPTISWITPSSAAPGSAAVTVTVNGEGFTPASTVLWNGSARTTTYKSETQLQAAITAADLATATTAQISVSNPAVAGVAGGGQSSAIVFLVTSAPAPAINVNGIVNGGSYAQSLAGNTIASIFGTNLAASTASATALPLPTSLAGVSVLVDGTPAPLFFVSAGQINFQLPWRLLNQTQTTIAVISNGAASAVSTVTLAAVAPAIFTLNANGTGQGAIQEANSQIFVAPAGTAVAQSRLGLPGDAISIFCTGLGAADQTSQHFADGTPAAFAINITGKATVTIGGVSATVTYAGLAPNYVGVYQVNAIIPAGAGSGSAIPVVLSVNGVPSNTVTIAMQ